MLTWSEMSRVVTELQPRLCGGQLQKVRQPNRETLALTVLLRHTDEQQAQLESELFAVSDPNSPRYGEHLTVDEISAIAALYCGRDAHLVQCW